MFSRFFIRRPIFACVVSILILVAGGVALLGLPVAQYPSIAPPTIQVEANFPGANAQTVAETVGAPVEQEVNGVEGMLYMDSVSKNDGSYTLKVTFDPSVDLDIAQVQVQNRVQAATPQLPQDVTRLGVKTQKKSPDFALCISISSTDGRYDAVFLRNFATLRLRDVLSRVKGVGSVAILGAADYSMRLWLDPELLQARDLTTNDVLSAVQEQNVQVAAGSIGEQPAPKTVQFTYTLSAQGRLSTVSEFQAIIVKTGEDGRVTRLGDVARIELGGENYRISSQLDGKPAATIMIYQLPGANVLEIAEETKRTMTELSATFPEGLEHTVSYDASEVVVASIDEIVTTLFIAALLVVLTVLLFLQDIRATLIPTVTIPVSLIGTFAVMSLLGFSINSLTLFGLVLAIGIVVDDAIVVVENVSRNLDELGLSAQEATERAMLEITGPVIATTLVLLAVFIPAAFMGGMTGVMFKQFGLTISAATVFSSLNALTLSPALCALLMRPTREARNPIYRGFNAFLGWSTRGYTRLVELFVRKLLVTGVVFGAVVAASAVTMTSLPTAFVPPEDQGYVILDMALPDAAAQHRTQALLDEKIIPIVRDTPGVARVITITGQSFVNDNTAGNVASAVIVFKPWSERPPEQVSDRLVASMNRRLAKVRECRAMVFATPPLPGLGLTAGFDMRIQDRAGQGLELLDDTTQALLEGARTQSSLGGVSTGFRANIPQMFVKIDREKAKRMGIPLQSIFDTLQAYLGSAYVNGFNKLGRTFRVYAQGDAAFRATPSDLDDLRVRSETGQMIPLGTLVEVRPSFGPQTVSRYNVYPAVSIKGSPAPGYSSGQALEVMEGMAAQMLPDTMGYEWTGVSFQEKAASGGQSALIFCLSILFVYLVLAAQYESWTIPMSVVLAVPLGVFGATLFTLLRGYTNNAYTQIGLVLLIGLVCKNSILIVEFARELRSQGRSVVDAALESARLRFRPILMTALSFVLGTLPLLVASGAGAGSRKALGTSVFGGMIVATILGVLITPALFRILQGVSERFSGGPSEPLADEPEASEGTEAPPAESASDES